MRQKQPAQDTHWNRWYLFVLLMLVVEIGIFYYLTRHFQ